MPHNAVANEFIGCFAETVGNLKNKIKLLIICPRNSEQLYGSGNWKDIKALEQLVSSLKIVPLLIGIDSSHSEQALGFLHQNLTDIIVQYSFWPELILAIRQRLPAVRIHVRTVNAEAFQHWQRADVRWSLDYENIRAVYGGTRLLYRDSRCRRLANNLLGISEWDNHNYWRYLPGRARILDMPYHSPWPNLRPAITPLPWDRRRDAVVCLAGGRDRIGLTQAAGLVRLAEVAKAHPDLAGWVFELSPGVLTNEGTPLALGSATQMTTLDEPWDLLCAVKALAILTPLGFGMKTTIIDALTAGCHVLVDRTLASRLPLSVRALCQVIDHRCEETIHAAFSRIRVEPAANDINAQLAATALEALANCLEVERAE